MEFLDLLLNAIDYIFLYNQDIISYFVNIGQFLSHSDIY